MFPRDYAEEMALIEMSRMQRQTLERWFWECIDAGEAAVAEEVRQAITVKDMERAAA